MSTYILLDSKLVLSCREYRKGLISSKQFKELLNECSLSMNSLETRKLENMVLAAIDRYNSIFWYPYEEDEEPEVTETIEKEVRSEILPYVEKIEKLIIRGSEEGAPVTDEERQAWWKMQKEREREEFYKMNGYYEDDE